MHYEGGGDANSKKATVGGMSQGGGDKVGIAIPASRMSDLITNQEQSIPLEKLLIQKLNLCYCGGSPIGSTK